MKMDLVLRENGSAGETQFGFVRRLFETEEKGNSEMAYLPQSDHELNVVVFF